MKNPYTYPHRQSVTREKPFLFLSGGIGNIRDIEVSLRELFRKFSQNLDDLLAQRGKTGVVIRTFNYPLRKQNRECFLKRLVASRHEKSPKQMNKRQYRGTERYSTECPQHERPRLDRLARETIGGN